jgi:hypothetical protein
MEDTISLRCHISALETELRLVKEQHVQSQNSITYLITILSNQNKPTVQTNQDQDNGTLRSQLENALHCNAQLERMITTAQWAKLTPAPVSPPVTSEELQETVASPVVVEERDVGDLLGCLSEEEDQEMSRIQDDVSGRVSEEGVREGWAKIQYKTCEKYVNASDQQVSKPGRILTHEHNRLAGAACFIEDLKDPDEYAKYWVNYACQHQDHTADEWRSYYEARIRPTRCETGTAEQVKMHSYSIDEVKQYNIPTAVQATTSPVSALPHDIPTVVQPATSPVSPLQHSQWAAPQPVARWPAPAPRLHVRSLYAGNSYLSYGVTHYPASKDVGLRRSVLISNIPIGMAVADVLLQLESDRIVEAKFAGTAGMKTLPPIMTNMAIVDFLDNEDAQMYVDVYAKHAMFDLKLIATPTRPLRRSRVDSGYN